jgi:hypothetical protein
MRSQLSRAPIILQLAFPSFFMQLAVRCHYKPHILKGPPLRPRIQIPCAETSIRTRLLLFVGQSGPSCGREPLDAKAHDILISKKTFPFFFCLASVWHYISIFITCIPAYCSSSHHLLLLIYRRTTNLYPNLVCNFAFQMHIRHYPE